MKKDILDKEVDLRLQRTYFVKGWDFGLKRYEELLKFQKGVCAICQLKPDTMRLSVDHQHYGDNAGLIRGLLCMRCNRGYGLFHDNNYTRLLRAADYLINPPAVQLWGKKFTAPGGKSKKRTKLLKKMRENV